MKTTHHTPAPQLHLFHATQVNLLTEIESSRKAITPATTSTRSSAYTACIKGTTYGGRTAERTYEVTARSEKEARAKALEHMPDNWQTGEVITITKN